MDLLEKYLYVVPTVLAVDEKGRLFVMDNMNNRVILLNQMGKVLTDLPTSHGHACNMGFDQQNSRLIYAHSFDVNSPLTVTVVELQLNF